MSEERKESDAGSGSGCVLTVFVSGDSGCSSEAARRIGADSGKSGVTLSGFADNDETVDIIKIPAAVADTGVCNPELTVYIALFPGRIAEKQTVQCAGTGDKCVGAEDRDKRAGGKSHMKFQTALVISDLDTDKSAVFSLFPVIVFVKIRNKTFVCRQNGHFLFGVFSGSICKEETRYDDRKAEE